jgi:DNA-binding SARP family transcriptional activator
MWLRVYVTFPTQYARIDVRSVLVGLRINLYMLSVRHMDELLHNNLPSIKLRAIATITYVLKMFALCTRLL